MKYLCTVLLTFFFNLSIQAYACVGDFYPKYKIEGDDLKYVKEHACKDKIIRKKSVIGADVDSIKFSNNDSGLGDLIAIDDENVFCKGNLMKNVSPLDLSVVHIDYFNLNYFHKSGSKVYFDCNIIYGVDGNSFKIIEENQNVIYFKDDDFVFMKLPFRPTQKVIGANPHSFEIVRSVNGEVFSKDSNSVYYNGKKYKGYDSNEFNIYTVDNLTQNNRDIDENKNRVFDLTEKNTKKLRYEIYFNIFYYFITDTLNQFKYRFSK